MEITGQANVINSDPTNQGTITVDIKKVHTQYRVTAAAWQLIHDCLAGEDVVKSKKEMYLPFPVALTPEQKATPKYIAKYEVYRQGASFTNYVEQTNEDLVAGCFKRDVATKVPKALEYINVDDTARGCVETVSAYGRTFLVADYPTTPEGTVLTKAQENALGLQAYISQYHPLAVINWDSKMVGGNEVLTRVVCTEERFVGDVVAFTYREFIVDPADNVYKIRLYVGDASGTVTNTPTQIITPKIGGKTLNQIPGVFIGSVNNNSRVDKVPLVGVARSNIKHYQTMAELFYVQTMVGHPQLLVTGAESGSTTDDKGNKVKVEIDVGVSDAIVLEGSDIDAKFLEIDAANLIHFKTLDQLEKSMLEQGARLKMITYKAGVESDAALRTRNAGSVSTLSKIATNVERGLVDVLWWCGQFMGDNTAKDKYDVDINKEFFDTQADATVLTSLNALIVAGVVPDFVLYDYLRTCGMVDEDTTNDDLRNGIDESTAKQAGMVNADDETDATGKTTDTSTAQPSASATPAAQ